MIKDSQQVQEDQGLREFFGTLKRQKGIIILVVIVAAVLAGVKTVITEASYRTVVRILVDAQTPTSTQERADPVNAVLVPNVAPEVQNQMEELASPDIIQRAFNTAQVPAPNEVDLASGRLVVVKQVNTSSAIDIAIELSNEDRSSKVAAAFPTVYSEILTKRRKQELAQATEVLKGRLDSETAKLEAARQAFNKFEISNPLDNLEGSLQERAQRLSGAKSTVQNSEQTIAGLEKKISTLIAERQKFKKKVDTSISETNPQVEAQRKELVQLKAQRANLITNLDESSPEVKALDAQIKVQQDYLNSLPAIRKVNSDAPNPILQSFEDRIAETRASLDQAKAERIKAEAGLEAAKKDLETVTKVQPERQKLIQNLAKQSSTVDQLKRDFDEFSFKSQTQKDPVRVINISRPEQVEPQPVKNMIAALIIGIALAIPLALFKDKLEDRVTSTDEVYGLMGSPPIGAVSTSNQLMGRSTFSKSALLESYRALRFNIQLASQDLVVQSLLITSTSSSEGKSEMSLNLAMESATDQRRTILVDTNIRRPVLHKKLNLELSPGLTDYLTGAATLEQILKQTSQERLTLIPAGTSNTNPTDLLASEKMSELHQELRKLADIVILDGAPCTLAADARILARLADGVVCVAQVGKTKRRALKYAIEMLRRTNARILGVVFSDSSRKPGSDPFAEPGW